MMAGKQLGCVGVCVGGVGVCERERERERERKYKDVLLRLKCGLTHKNGVFG